MRTTVVLVGSWIFTLWGPAWTKPSNPALPTCEAIHLKGHFTGIRVDPL
ncbi:MAG: hypothetical protein PHI39_09180 [Kiritimatiellae bacterium]|nr:hypothetical protein [Kiritimatiellia bacterium]